MNNFADFFVATAEEALRYALRASAPDSGKEICAALHPCEYMGITGSDLVSLWAFLAGNPPDALKHELEVRHFEKLGGSMLIRFSAELISLLADATPQRLKDASNYWAKPDEMDCTSEEVLPILNNLQTLSRRAIKGDRSVYLWVHPT